MFRLQRLPGFVSAHPDGHKVYRASVMIFRVMSDASYLSHPNAGSVAGSHHFLGLNDGNNPQSIFLNHPISAHSTRIPIPVVCSSAFEAEYAGLFSSARVATDERSILINVVHPQPPTTFFCDNECAIGIANRTVTSKMSKTVDMRFNWVQDRVKQKQFRRTHVRDLLNLGDFFTKSLPVARHRAVALLLYMVLV
jgi:hypothetical protein